MSELWSLHCASPPSLPCAPCWVQPSARFQRSGTGASRCARHTSKTPAHVYLLRLPESPSGEERAATSRLAVVHVGMTSDRWQDSGGGGQFVVQQEQQERDSDRISPEPVFFLLFLLCALKVEARHVGRSSLSSAGIFSPKFAHFWSAGMEPHAGPVLQKQTLLCFMLGESHAPCTRLNDFSWKNWKHRLDLMHLRLDEKDLIKWQKSAIVSVRPAGKVNKKFDVPLSFYNPLLLALRNKILIWV